MNRSNTPRDTEFRRIIGGYIEVSGLTREQISANLGISPQYVSYIFNGKRSPKDAEQKMRGAVAEIIEKREKIKVG